MTKRILLAVFFALCCAVPVMAEDRPWEWAILPAYDIDADTFGKGARFSEGLAAVKKDGKYGYIDPTGAAVIPFIFEKAGPFHEGLAAATVDGVLMGFIRYLPPTVAVMAAPVPTPSPVPTPAPGDKTAYITIDDGPSRRITPRMLDILSERGVKATFFVLPHDDGDALYQRIIDEGHELASHSFSHDLKRLYDPDDTSFFEADTRKAHQYLTDKGHTPALYRFPGGSGGRAAAVMEPRLAFIKSLGYRHFNWDVSVGDTDSSPAGKNVDVLVNNVLLNTRDRKKLVILMHDTADKTATPEALPRIIDGLRGLGYGFDTLRAY